MPRKSSKPRKPRPDAPVAEALEEQAPPDLLEESTPTSWELVDQGLRGGAHDLTERFLDYTALVARALDEKVYEHFGFSDPQPYFEERIGVSYHTLTRYLAIHHALESLADEQKDTVRTALASMGIHKAAALAPAIRRQPERLAEWLDAGKKLTAPALQEQISSALGLRPRGAASTKLPGHSFLASFVNHMPPNRREYTERVFLAAMPEPTANPVAVACVMVDLFANDLRASGYKNIPFPPTESGNIDEKQTT